MSSENAKLNSSDALTHQKLCYESITYHSHTLRSKLHHLLTIAPLFLERHCQAGAWMASEEHTAGRFSRALKCAFVASF